MYFRLETLTPNYSGGMKAIDGQHNDSSQADKPAVSL